MASKLFAGFGVLCLLLAVVVGVGVSRLQASQADLTDVSTNGMTSIEAVSELDQLVAGFTLPRS
ncbi:Tar ligand binding domain-containing protein [Kineococcus arenarius]|uniref:Tar ligand binding domain-containing protein n=1 Tax=unclassified Kineococcus TaxID=2621656 RepID=UPI003D7E4980